MSFTEDVKTIANATSLATGDIVEDTEQARDEAVAAANSALTSEINAGNSENLAKKWAENGHNTPVQGEVGVDAEYSAFHWSVEASLFIGDPVINDTITSSIRTWSSVKISNDLSLKSDIDHLHTGIYEPVFLKNSAFNKNFSGTGLSEDIARQDHNHDLIYEPKRITEGSAYNKDFGTISGSVMEGDRNFDSNYMPLVAQGTAYNKNFVVDTNNPLSEEVPRGTHNHTASGISYDNTGNQVITSTTVQGGMSQLDASVALITIAEKCNLGAGMTNPSQVVTITGAGVASKLITAMTINIETKNALYSGGDLTINYPVDPEKLIAGWLSASVTITILANKEYAMAIMADDVVIDNAFRAQLGSAASGTTGDFSFNLDGYISEIPNGTRLSVALYNITDSTDITVLAHTISFAGEPEGSLVVSGGIVDHSDLTGTGAANGVHTTSDIQDLDTQLAGKTITSTFTNGNIAEFDVSGNLIDSGIAPSALDAFMNKVGSPTLDNIVVMTSAGDSKDAGIKTTDLALVGGNSSNTFLVSDATLINEAISKGQLDALSSVYTLITTFDSHVAASNPHNTTFTDVGASALVHMHTIADTTSLQDTLDAKYLKVIAPPTGNIPMFNAGDTLIDSGQNLISIQLTGELA